jgi:hypothetical protein
MRLHQLYLTTTFIAAVFAGLSLSSLNTHCAFAQTNQVSLQVTQEPKPEPPQPDYGDESDPSTESPSTTQRVVRPENIEANPKPEKPSFTGPTAKGRVFVDIDNNGIYSENDQVFSKAQVSNGKVIVETDESGVWELPLEDESIFFLIKPTGYRSPLDENKIPKFFYIHKPNGSPVLKYPGSQPTGPIPDWIDFPLYQQTENESFEIILFGDPQPRNIQEVDYIMHDVISGILGNTNASFGVSLGDLAFDNLETLEPLTQAIGKIGIPWHNVIGNHDLNLDANKRKHINETFESYYGPTYYSFNYGQVHFVVLDNIDWAIKENRGRFVPKFGAAQIKFLRDDLAATPDSQTVVLLMHVPILSCEDHQEIFRLIEDRSICVSISAHKHIHKHQFLGEAEGWKGKKPHHHIVNVTVSGSWWSGAKNDRSIPHSTMSDGAPNGYSIMSFSPDDYKMDFRAAGAPDSEQMRVHMPMAVTPAEGGEVWVNVYNGSEKSTVEMAINDEGQWSTLEQAEEVDPHYTALVAAESKFNPPIEPKLKKPSTSSHLWKGTLPLNLPQGTHLLRVKTTDMHGRTFYGQRSFRVTE